MEICAPRLRERHIPKAGVEVRFCDLPQIEGPTGRFMVQQMVAVAELEAGLIGDRTRKALAAAKARGKNLSTPANLQHREFGRKRARAARIRSADARALDLAKTIKDVRASGASSLREIAVGLNDRGIPTAPSGTSWSATQVQRVLACASRTSRVNRFGLLQASPNRLPGPKRKNSAT